MGKVLRAWNIFEEWRGMPRADVLRECELQGLNRNMAATQYSRWKQGKQIPRGFTYPDGRAPSPAPSPSPSPKPRPKEHANAARLREEWETQRVKFPALSAWRLVIETRPTRRLGVCKYRQRVIGISAWHVESGKWEHVRDTLLHEIAHALAGARAKHGPEWKRQCLIVGANPRRLATEDEAKGSPSHNRPRPWRVVCPRCGDIGGYTREPKWWKRYLARTMHDPDARTGARCRKCKSMVHLEYGETTRAAARTF